TGRSLKADRNMNHFINLTYFSVRLLILLLSDPRISSLSSSAHTYRLLIFKEHVCEGSEPLGSAAFSAAEKRDYEPCFAARQQLSERLRCDCGAIFLRRRGSLHLNPTAPLPFLPRCVSVSAKEA
ncbi:hypothetical protein, partial [Burkholderia sp. BCC0801]|uniref:hypothetical protein n=1 Tax=Burkholderia sp. BCC0801 TaxID=2676291 RepID=UPI001ABBCDB0